MPKQQRWIGVACVDWDNAALVASQFYPEDVPAEWQLTYYANYMMACVISPEKWQVASASVIADWCEQTQDNFWFYLLCETPEQIEAAQSCAQLFPNKLAGLLISQAMANDLIETDLVSLRIGYEVFNYDYEQLRAAKPALLTWIASEGAQAHALVLMSASSMHQLRDVQTLLELLGVGT